MKEKPSLIKLFLYFLKIGLVTFGGGYAIIATLEKELVDEKQWITHEDMLNMVVIGESTPGPIAINLATFIGFKMYGFWGSFLCTLGFILPSFAIIVLVSVAIDYIKNVPDVVKWMFKGIRAGVVVLIGNAAVKFFKKMDKKIITFLLFFMAFFVGFFTDLNVIYLILIGGAVGLIYTLLVTRYTQMENSTKSGKKTEFTGKISENSDGCIENNNGIELKKEEETIVNTALNNDISIVNEEPIKDKNINVNESTNTPQNSENNVQSNDNILDVNGGEICSNNCIKNDEIIPETDINNYIENNDNNNKNVEERKDEFSNEGGMRWYTLLCFMSF